MSIASVIHPRRLALALCVFCSVALPDGYAVDSRSPAQREAARRALDTMKARVGALQQELAASESAEAERMV